MTESRVGNRVQGYRDVTDELRRQMVERDTMSQATSPDTHRGGRRDVTDVIRAQLLAKQQKPTQSGYHPGKAAVALGGTLARAPENIAASAVRAYKGQSGASVVNQDLGDRFVNWIDERNRSRSEEYVKEHGDRKAMPGIDLTDIADLAPNIGFSGVSAAAGLVTGVATAKTVAGAPFAWAAGMTASGAAAYRQAGHMFTKEYLTAKNEEKIRQTGQQLTPAEENTLKKEFEHLAREYALWEAVPEAIGNVAQLKVLITPLSRMLGKHMATRIVSKVTGLYGPELATETITEIGQSKTEVKAGLAAPGEELSFTKPRDIAKAATDVAPQVFLLTSLFGGVGGAAVAYSNNKKSRAVTEGVSAGAHKDLSDNDLANVIKGATELSNERPRDKKLSESIGVLKSEADRRMTETEETGSRIQEKIKAEQPTQQQDDVGDFVDNDQAAAPAVSQPVISQSADPKTAALETFKAYAQGGMSLPEAFERRNELVKMMPEIDDDLNKIIIEAEGNRAFAHPGRAATDLEAQPAEPIPTDGELYNNLNTSEDVDRLFKFKAQQYGSKKKYLASDEYAQAYPVIDAIYQSENEQMIEAGRMALQDAGLEHGHRVMLEQNGEKIRGRLIFTGNKEPYVAVQMAKNLGLPKTMPWHTGWKMDGPADRNTALRESGLTETEIDYVLDEVATQMREGEGGGIKGADDATGEFVYGKSTYPDWFRDLVKRYKKKGKSISSEQVAAIIGRVRGKHVLQDNQGDLYYDIVDAIKREVRPGGAYYDALAYYREMEKGEQSEITGAIERVDGGKISDVEERIVEDFQEAIGEEGNLTAGSEEAALDELADFFANVSEAAGENAAAVTTDRRVDASGRKRWDDMTDAERRRAYMTDPKTGLLNERAFEESERKPFIAYIDGDSLGAINDHYGHEAGDRVLRVWGDALSAANIPETYHLHGDELAMEADTAEALDAAMQKAYSYLQEHPIEVVGKTDGETYYLRGGLSYGIGTDKETADIALYDNKKRRLAAGERSPKGSLPPGVYRRDAEVGRNHNRREVFSAPEVERKPAQKGEIETGVLDGMSEAETLTLNNPETEWSEGLPTENIDGLIAPTLLIEDVKDVFNGQEVYQAANGKFVVKIPRGKYIIVETVKKIDVNDIAFEFAYGEKYNETTREATGVYKNGVIKLHAQYGGKAVLYHESVHAMEDIGVLNSLDVAALRGHIKRLTREGKFKPVNKNEPGGAEDRANFIADALTAPPKGSIGRIIDRIKDFIDKIVNALGIRTARGIIRDIKTGKVYGKVDSVPEKAYNYSHENDARTSYVSDSDGGDNRIDAGRNAILSSYKPNIVGREKVGTIAGTGRKITSPHDVAQIAANYLGKYPDENFLSFVLDGKNKLLHVYRHTIGSRGRAGADPGTLVGEALNTPGAKAIILAHQHPSQTPALSPEDRRFYRDVTNLARGSEIVVLDGLAVTRTQYTSFSEEQSGRIEPHESKAKIPLVGRVFKQVHNGEKISDAAGASMAAQRYIPGGGTLLLDGNNAVAGFIELSDYRAIRGEAQTELLKNLEMRNSRAMIIHSPTREIEQAEAKNAVAFAKAADQSLLDIIGPSGAMSEKGGIPDVPIGTEFYSVKDEGKYSIRKQQDPPASKDPAVLNRYLKDETDAIVQTILHKLRPKNMTWLETMLKSPEWFDHPQVNKIVRLFMRDRNEIYHETFNSLNAVATPIIEGETVASAAKALKDKGISRADRIAGKVSKEYKLLEHFLDYFDTKYKQNPKKTLEENLTDCEAFMRGMGATDDVVRVWRLYRDSYDKALDIQTREMRKMIAEIIAEAADKGVSPDLDQMKDTLKGALAQMEQWRGFYAPRLRERGEWKVQAYKEGPGGKETDRTWYRDHRGTELSAQRLAKKLEREGWKVYSVNRVEKLPEDIYQDTNAVATAKLIDTALDRLSLQDGFGPALTAQFNEEVLRVVADEIRARGFRSHMMNRKEGRVVKGYIEDPIRRHVLYTNQIASGTAKARVARMASKELLGERVKGKLVGGIDPVKEAKEYQVAQNYLKEQLRNLDASDRVIGIAKSIATMKFLGFNLRSMAVNLTAIVTTAPASIHQYAMGGKGSMFRVLDALGRAGKDYGAMMAGKKLANADEQAFLEEVHRKGWDDAQYTRDALGTMEQTHSKVWGTLMDASMYVFGKSEQWNRGTTMLAAYRLARKQGKDHATAAEAAKESADRAHGVYGRSTLPMWAQGTNPAARIGQMLYIYSKFSHNYLQMLYDVGAKRHNVKAAMYAFLSPIVVAGGAALPFKDQIFAFAGFILRSLFGEDRDPEKWVWDIIREHLGDTAEKVGRHGLTGAAGVDISGSLSIGVGIPKNMLELTGAIGGVIDSMTTGGTALARGQYSKAVENVLPTGLANPIKAYRESQEGVSTRANNRVWDEQGRPLKPGPGESMARVAGFRSTRQAVLSERTWEGKRQSGHYAELRQSICQRYRAWALGDRRPDEHKAIIKQVREYNDKVKHLKEGEVPRITFASMRGQLTRMQRAPKAVRANLTQ